MTTTIVCVENWFNDVGNLVETYSNKYICLVVVYTLVALIGIQKRMMLATVSKALLTVYQPNSVVLVNSIHYS